MQFTVVAVPGALNRGDLDTLIEDLSAQHHDHWELLVPDGEALGRTSPRFTHDDHRVLFGGSARCVRHRQGALILIDHALRLPPGALATIAGVIDSADPGVITIVYGDELIDGDRWHKPAWSPERLLGQDYLTGLACFGGHPLADLLSQQPDTWPTPYELALRAMEHGAAGLHVPEVLAHRTRSAVQVRRAQQASIVRSHLARVGRAAVVEPHDHGCLVRPTATPDHRVSIIIPTAGQTRSDCRVTEPLVIHCVRQVLAQTRHRSPLPEILVVVDDQVPAPVLAWLREHRSDGVRVLVAESPFNFSQRVNQAAVNATGEALVLLNDDVEVADPAWLDRLLALLALPNVAMVGPLLVFEDGRIQSAGHTHAGGQPWSTGRLRPGDDPGPHGLFRVTRETSGVTGACAVMRRSVFCEVGGMSERWPVDFGDVDLCLKVLATGWRILWTPAVRLVHFERSSRAPTAVPGALESLAARWRSELQHDPFDPDGPHTAMDPETAMPPWQPARLRR